MTPGLVKLGYTDRESDFLRLASLSSGYFVRAQFNEYIGRKSGALAQRFIERGISHGHLKVLPALGGRVVYHVAASQIYAALGDTDNRNRREHRWETIRERLMTLDYLLCEPGSNNLLTESEKVAFFSTLGIAKADLPRMALGGKVERYFPEKLPIAVTAANAPVFAFIDAGTKTLSAWESFLRVHRTLIQRLPKTSVVFASFHPARFDRAEDLFRKTVVGASSSGGIDVERLKRFFASRKLFEEKRLDSFDQTKLDEFRENKRVFGGSEIERLYEDWRKRGEADFARLQPSAVSFRAVVLPHNYEWLSPIQTYERRG